MIDVGCAENGDTFPREGKQRAPIFGVQEAHSSRKGKCRPWEDKMAAANLTQPSLPVYMRPQFVSPGAGSVYNHWGVNFNGSTCAVRPLIAHRDAMYSTCAIAQ